MIETIYARRSTEPRGVNQRNGRIVTMKRLLSGFAVAVLCLAGCSTTGNLGMVTKNMADSASLLRSGRAFEELGPVEGQACRYFLLAVIPWGASDMETALNKALTGSGDALINVSVTTSLYGFFPIYNVFSLSCTTIKGVAVKFQTASSTGGPPGENPPQIPN